MSGPQQDLLSSDDGHMEPVSAIPVHRTPSGKVIMEGMEQLSVQADSNEHLTEAERRMKEEEISFYSASENDHGDDNIWGLLSGVGGNVYEWYDFAVYGLLAPEIGAAFFPKSSAKLQLINSFGIYLAAFLMRPIGAIFFGELGDRVFGRKHALVVSIVLITVPSVLMGILPGYDTWSWVSPVLLVLLRMLQGLSVGGQLAGSYVLAIEQASSSTRGFRGAVCDASSVGGFLLASAVTSTVRFLFTAQQVNDWAWRVPFWFSLVLAPVLYNVVKHTEESKHWEERTDLKDTEDMIRQAEASNAAAQPAFMDILQSPFRRRQLAGAIGALSAVTSSFYVLLLFTPVYLSELRGIMSQRDADFMNLCVVACYIVFVLIAGKASDGFEHRMDLIRIGLPGIMVACPTMLGMFESNSWWGILIAQLQFGACLAMVQGSIAAWEVELWMADPTLSFTGVAIGHNVASTIFGGTMPLIATSLFYHMDNIANENSDDFWVRMFPRLVPGLYVSILAILSWICVSFVVRHPHDVRVGNKKLKAIVEQDRRKFKEEQAARKKAKKKRKQQLGQLEAGNYYQPPTTTAVFT